MTPHEIIRKYLIDLPEQADWGWMDHCDGLALGIVDTLKAHGYDLNRAGAALDPERLGAWLMEHRGWDTADVNELAEAIRAATADPTPEPETDRG